MLMRQSMGEEEMKSFFIYKNDAVRCGEAPQRPYYQEFCYHTIPTIKDLELDTPASIINRTRMFDGYRARQCGEDIMIYVER